jgi:hypothetical protein
MGQRLLKLCMSRPSHLHFEASRLCKMEQFVPIWCWFGTLGLLYCIKLWKLLVRCLAGKHQGMADCSLDVVKGGRYLNGLVQILGV